MWVHGCMQLQRLHADGTFCPWALVVFTQLIKLRNLTLQEADIHTRRATPAGAAAGVPPPLLLAVQREADDALGAVAEVIYPTAANEAFMCRCVCRC